MAPKKKKNVTNGFTMYMLEMQREISEQEGRRVPIPQLVEVANPQWKALSADQKAHYNNEAKRHKKGPKNGPLEGQGNKQGARSTDHRMDTTRNYISDRVSVADQLRERRENEKKLLTQNWPDGKGVCDRKFYFIAFQTLCKLPNDMGYLPCEVACAEYTLRNGIKRVYHRFLRPDPIPMGYRYTCKSNSENTHQIPIEGHEDATGDYQKVWRELVAFINPDNHRVTPAVFCESAQRGMVEWSLKWLSERAGISNSLRKAIEVELLMTQLYAHVEEVSHSWSMLSGMLGDSKWDHMNDTRCEFHEELDLAIHKCALGVVKKYCFHLSDPIASEVYNVTLTDKHLPERIDTDEMAAIVYPKITAPMSYQQQPRQMPTQQPPVARTYRSQQRQQQVSDQPIRRPTTDFASPSSSSSKAAQSNQYYASTEPEAPSPSAVPMPNFQWQTQVVSDPYATSDGTDQITHRLQSTTINSSYSRQMIHPGIGRGLGRGMPSRSDQPPLAMGIGRGIGRGFRGVQS